MAIAGLSLLADLTLATHEVIVEGPKATSCLFCQIQKSRMKFKSGKTFNPAGFDETGLLRIW